LKQKPKEDPLTHYCIVRADLPFGTKAAQLVHAAGESSPGNLPEGTYAVVLQARDEEHLNQVSVQLAENGILHCLIREPDEPWNGQLMAIGVLPMARSKVRKYLSQLPLLR
jgi:peptidyl-tRNA hydrolase